MVLVQREHEGMMVPWITRWSTEEPDDTIVNELHNGYRFRRRSEITDRSGTPQFAMVHSERSWQAAIRNLCQVCGLRGADIFRTWGEHENPQPTLETPLHQACLLTALSQCPNLITAAGHGNTEQGLEFQWWKCHARRVIGGLFSLPDETGARLYLFDRMTDQELETLVMRQPLIDIQPLEPWEGEKLWRAQKAPKL